MEDALRFEFLVARLMQVTGSGREAAEALLREARGEFETALSLFFEEAAVAAAPPSTSASKPILHPSHHQHLVPSNTPATPRAFPDALAAFQRMSTTGAAPTSLENGGKKSTSAPPPSK